MTKPKPKPRPTEPRGSERYLGLTGQASTEYLMILAVVIIIALIVIGVLGNSFGITGLITAKQNSIAFTLGSPFALKEAYWSGTVLKLVLENTANEERKLTEINIDGQPYLQDMSFNQGQNRIITLSSNEPCGTTGASRSLKLSFNYTTTYLDLLQDFPKPLNIQCS